MLSLEVLKDFNEFRRETPGTTLCPAPLVNLHFSQLGVVTACCFNRTLVLGVYPRNSVDEIWNGAPARELREALANNDLSKGCEKCFQQIEARDFGGSHAAFYSIFGRDLARRQRELGISPDVDQAATPLPMKLEFNIHNSCNLECIMCHGLASSSIARRREALAAMPNPYDLAFVDQLDPYLRHVVEADFMGGEPFLLPAYRGLWERIASVNPKTKVLILTNGTILDDDIKALLRRLNVAIHVSIDSDVKGTYESIRRNASYETVMANSEFYRELMQHTGHPLHWRYCPMRINWREMPETVRNCNEKGIVLHFNQVDSPINFSLTTLPARELEHVVRYLDENAPTDATTHIARTNRRNWSEMVARLGGFLDRGNRLNGLVARLDTAAAVVSQYSHRRAESLRTRLTVVEPESILTEAVKGFVITRLNVDQAVANEQDVPGEILERLSRRKSELSQAAEDIPVAAYARIFLSEVLRTFAGVWGVYEGHGEDAFARVEDLSKWIAERPNAPAAMSTLVETTPEELYRLIGLNESLLEAKTHLASDPHEAWLMCQKHGNHALVSGRHAEAVEAYELAVRFRPTATESYVNMGHAFCHLGRWQDVVRAYERARELDPDVSGVCSNLGDVLLRMGRWEDALAAYAAAMRERPDSASCYFNSGHALSHLNRNEEALEAYRRGLELNPNDGAPLHNIADTFMRMSRWEDAVAAYQEALAKHPGVAVSVTNLNRALSQVRRLEEARSREIAPVAGPLRERQDAGFHEKLGDKFSSMSRWGEATAAYRLALAEDPSTPSVNEKLAHAFFNAARYEEAVAAYRAALRERPDAAELHFNLGHVLTELKRSEEAVAAYANAVRLAPELGEARARAARALAASARWEDAVQAYRQAIARASVEETSGGEAGGIAQTGPGVSWLYRSLGDALLKLHRYEEAAAAYREADEMNPAWSRAAPGPVSREIERWLEAGWRAMSTGSRSGARPMFVLDSDYGELTTVMLFLFGQELAARATLVMSERVYVNNRNILPDRTFPVASYGDILRAVDREKPDVVFLCAAYLFSLHGLLSLDDLTRLVDALRGRGCRVVTTDPFLGLLAGIGSTTTVAVDIPPDSPPQIQRAKRENDELLHEHFVGSYRILKELPHLYPTAGRSAADGDPKMLSFFNRNLVCPAVRRPEVRANDEPSGKPRWLFVLASRDYEAQILFIGKDAFVDVVIGKIKETLNAGRHAVLVAPYDLVQAIIGRMPPADAVTLMTFCAFERFLALLLDAEYAFYWNVVSHSMLLRLMNGQPVFMFDRGHLVRNVTPLYERVVDWYYHGLEPLYLDQRARLDSHELERLARRSAAEWAQVAESFSRAPAPAALVERILSADRTPGVAPRALGTRPRCVSDVASRGGAESIALCDAPTSIRAIRDKIVIADAGYDVLRDVEGKEYIDLFTGNGAVLLGHADPVVRNAVQRQLEGLWIAGALQTPSGLEARVAVESFFPASYRLVGLYSTGMEAAEFALRIAREVTGRRGVVGFDGCMHGKSTATAFLGWPNRLVSLPEFQRLPYVPNRSDDQILEMLADTLSTEAIAAVFVEPLLGSAGGHTASPALLQEVARLCTLWGTLLVIDEIFTGFHRTGPAFIHQEIGLSPDIILIGKVMGNGFPVSGVVLDKKHPVDDRMLPGSTYSGNPLAASAVRATLSRIRELDVPAKVSAVEQIIIEELAPLRAAGIAVRGRGALWVIELSPAAVDTAMAHVFREGVMVSPNGSYLRLLPAATIAHERLSNACRIVRDACLAIVS